MNHELIFILKCIRIHSRISRRLCNLFLHSSSSNTECSHIICQNCLLTASVVTDVYGNNIVWIKISS